MCSVLSRDAWGAVAKWLTRRPAKPLCEGSNPSRTSNFSLRGVPVIVQFESYFNVLLPLLVGITSDAYAPR